MFEAGNIRFGLAMRQQASVTISTPLGVPGAQSLQRIIVARPALAAAGD